ncbi:MAG TPA: hypothetical protein DEV93_01620 [Chloroflexi bacterium]|nr:hypothetical protein [Chloroflexota bacterium]
MNGAQAFFGQPVDWALAGGAVDAHVASLIQPTPAGAEQVVGALVVAHTRPEVHGLGVAPSLTRNLVD